jgi:hypothetical protein
MTITKIIEELARAHTLVLHSDCEKHFASQADELDTSIDSLLHYPAILLKEDGSRIKGATGSYTMVRRFTLSVIEHVDDTGDYQLIDEVFLRTRRIAFDILNELHARKRLYALLKGFSLDGTEIYPILNSADSLFGQMVTFSLETSYTVCSSEGIFDFELLNT